MSTMSNYGFGRCPVCGQEITRGHACSRESQGTTAPLEIVGLKVRSQPAITYPGDFMAELHALRARVAELDASLAAANERAEAMEKALRKGGERTVNGMPCFCLGSPMSPADHSGYCAMARAILAPPRPAKEQRK